MSAAMPWVAEQIVETIRAHRLNRNTQVRILPQGSRTFINRGGKLDAIHPITKGRINETNK